MCLGQNETFVAWFPNWPYFFSAAPKLFHSFFFFLNSTNCNLIVQSFITFNDNSKKFLTCVPNISHRETLSQPIFYFGTVIKVSQEAVGMFQKSGLKYRPGDSISIICTNDDREVSQLITRWDNAYWWIDDESSVMIMKKFMMKILVIGRTSVRKHHRFSVRKLSMSDWAIGCFEFNKCASNSNSNIKFQKNRAVWFFFSLFFSLSPFF